MTIKIEREAVLYVLSRPPQSTLSAPTAYQSHYDTSRLQPYDDEAEIVVNPAKEDAVILVPISPSRYNSDRRRLLTLRVEPVPEAPCKNTNDDSIREAPSEPRRRVTFAKPLVTDVRTRPRTLPEDLRALFYTYEETQRFRQEYRMERKMLEDSEEDPATVSTTQPSVSATDKDDDLSPSSAWQGPLGSRRHHISRVVIRHHDTLATFYDATLEKKRPTDSLSAVGLGAASIDEMTTPPTDTATPTTTSTQQGSEDFFDNDSFWSGSITWY